jgi:KDO2-lipid IV(A) lauroyltransferase
MQYAMLRALKNTFIYHFTMGAVTLVGFTPARLAGPVGRVIGRLAHLLAKPERRLALHHLGRTLDSSQSKNRARLLTRGVFIELARNTVELCRLRNTPDKLPNVVFSKTSRRALEDALSKKRGVVFVTGHFGNWELLAHTLARSGYPISTVAKESYDPRFTAQIDRFRSNAGVQVIWRGRPGAPTAMLRALKQGRAVGFLIDQDTAVPSTFVPFFGRSASTPIGAAALALRTEAPVVVGTIHRTPSGRHVIDIEACPIPSDVEKATALMTSHLEARIRRHPTQWVWFHKRWNTKPTKKAAA